jgi:hypothetical protein
MNDMMKTINTNIVLFARYIENREGREGME